MRAATGVPIGGIRSFYDTEGFCILGLFRETGKKTLLKDIRGRNGEKQKKAAKVLL